MPQCFSPAFVCCYVYKRTCRTKRVKEQIPSYIGRVLNLGALKEAFATRFGAALPFDLSGRDTQGQPTMFSAQFSWQSGFARLEGSLRSKTWIARVFSRRLLRSLHDGVDCHRLRHSQCDSTCSK